MTKEYIFSAPGRTEIGGNHTDHQNGCVLAAAIDLKITAKVQPNDSRQITITSHGYPDINVCLDDLKVYKEEQNTSASLVRGVAAGFSAMGIRLRGFHAEITSNVMPGSGLSSSAAFEVLMGTICNTLFFDGRLSPVEIARIGQYAENIYFGKPCGLMDQITSAVGGAVFIDFKNTDAPVVEPLTLDLASTGHSLCIIESGANHAELTDEYAAITEEMKEVCGFFGKSVLRQIPEDGFFKALPELRHLVPDRALLRSIHIYQENKRVLRQMQALKTGNIPYFLSLVRESGRSSWMYMQNITPTGAVKFQETALALALCDSLLNGKGAHRIHGGGFAGTIQAFVPLEMTEKFKDDIEAVLGKGACHVLDICSHGGILENKGF